MDAVEFVKQVRRMKEKGVLKKCYIFPSVSEEPEAAEDVVTEVEEWVKMNPIKTRQSEFLKLFPGADVDDTGDYLVLNPCYIHPKMRRECSGRKCSECRKAFWLEEVE